MALATVGKKEGEGVAPQTLPTFLYKCHEFFTDTALIELIRSTAMATRRNIEKKGTKRDAPNIMNFFNINGMLYSLGDVRKSEFANIEDPKASVKSIQAWAIQINNILRGFPQESSNLS